MPKTFIFSLLFSVIVVAFALQNSDVVTINFIFMQQEMSLALVILLSAASGAIIVLLLGVASRIKAKMKIHNLSKTITKTEKADKILKEKEDRNHLEQIEEENRVLKKKGEKIRDLSEANDNSQEDGTIIYTR